MQDLLNDVTVKALEAAILHAVGVAEQARAIAVAAFVLAAIALSLMLRRRR